MDKCFNDKYFLDRCHCDSWNMFIKVPGTYIENMVKIESVAAEILLIWINVARTNVAWTNVHLTIVLDWEE